MNTRKSQLTKSKQIYKPISKAKTDKLAQLCSSISDTKTSSKTNKNIKTEEIVGIPTLQKPRHSTSQRVKGVILALKQKSISSFIGDDQLICSSPLLKNHNWGYFIQMGQI